MFESTLSLIDTFLKTGSVSLQILFFVLFLAYVTYLGASRLNIKVLRTCAFIILVLGIALYGYGFTLANELEGPVTIFLRSLLSSIELFVSHTDLLEIEEAQDKPFFLDVFVFVYACAVVTSISTIISLFGKRAMTGITLKFYNRRHVKVKHVFFGMDTNSINLAQELNRKDKIVFIEFPSDEEAEKLSFGSIIQNVFNGMVTSNGINDKHNITILRATHKITDLTKGKDMLEQMGLGLLKNIVDDSTVFYLLADDSIKDIDGVMILTTDPFFKNHSIQCHAYKKGLTHQYELSLYDTQVHFFYPNSVAVNMMREYPPYFPIEIMDIAKDKDGKSLGYVNDKSFRGMIFGFRESGQEMLKFVLKYGSFVDKDANPLDLKIYLQDPKMDEISGSYKATLPGFPDNGTLVFEKLDFLSEEFWVKLRERIDDMNYIVFNCHDDNDNLNAATQIFDYAERNRKNGVKGLKIVIRVKYRSENRRTIVEFYNFRAGFKCIIPYGDKIETFKPKWLVSGNSLGIPSHAVNYGKAMLNCYYKVNNLTPPTWKERNEACIKARKDKDLSTLMQKIRYMHEYIRSAYYALNLAVLGKGNEEIYKNIPLDINEFNKLPEDQKKLIDTLTKTLHVSWWSDMVLQGYVYAPKSVEVERKNQYLTEWENLTEDGKHLFRIQLKGLFVFLEEKEKLLESFEKEQNHNLEC